MFERCQKEMNLYRCAWSTLSSCGRTVSRIECSFCAGALVKITIIM
ncbi:hypothetical protein SAMN05216489_05688 [Streptomyces sp. 3213]|nr:hypothetical protein SAMN05216489_05688 [Streptomyces sp. 3213] [Streptomyces sp. 3213.3]